MIGGNGRGTEFVAAFLEEADELLRAADGHLLQMEAALRAGSSPRRALRETFRAVHTVKGLAAMVGFDPIVALSHRMEAILRTADRSGVVHARAVAALLQGTRVLEQQLRDVATGRPLTEADPDLLEELEHVGGEPTEAAAPDPGVSLPPELAEKLTPGEQEQLARGIAEGRRAVRLEFVPSHERAGAGQTIASVREQLSAAAEVVKVVPRGIRVSDASPGGVAFDLLVLTQQTPEETARLAGLDPGSARLVALPAPEMTEVAAPPEEEEPAAREQRQRPVVRVEVSRLDEAMEGLSALLVTRFRFARALEKLVAAGADVRELRALLADHERQLRDMRGALLRVRLVRVSEILARVPLILRSLRRSTGKPVRLEMDAGTAEVDKSVGDRLFPAVIHLVRNAIDHAIESPDERRAAGKPAEGTLSISCFERSNTQLELSVSDDGRGIDPVEVARRADAAVPPNDAALLELLCRPGFSTREQVTDTSGRGMGMDIVKRTVEQLGGELLLSTEPGRGTTFTLRVPVTISIVDAFSLQTAGHRFVVPVSMVEEIIELDRERLSLAPSRADRVLHLLERRGEAVPVVDLAAAFQLPHAPEARDRAVVVRRGGEPIAFAVHRLLGQQEVVVRPLDDHLVRSVGVSGATDLGDGLPILVLDLVSLGGALLGSTQGRAEA